MLVEIIKLVGVVLANLGRVWRRISPYKNLMRLFDWLGPRGSLMLICGLIWLQTGIGTLQGYSGQPTDAPHLLVPAIIRGTMWILTAVVAIALCPTRSIKYHRVAIAALSLMPTIRLLSYLMSWVISWSAFQAVFPHFPLYGAPNAEYTSTFWQAEIVLVVALMLAPATWRMVSSYLIQEGSGEFDRTSRAVADEGTAANEESDGEQT